MDRKNMQQRIKLHGIKLIIRGDKHYDTIPLCDVADELLLKNIGIKGINLYPNQKYLAKRGLSAYWKFGDIMSLSWLVVLVGFLK